ncbi:glycine zipper 2TM domain-containing protein [Fontivita pretiosa]|uniref:glycine zipper 2TM domain-containing protein n=1 Tax=Fontivita pretiosa TaxID=2989684 RepID=UPI003D1867F0
MLFRGHAMTAALLCGALAGAPLMVGCESLPGDEKTQGAVIGGLAGAGAGAVLAGEDNRLLGALIGGAAGAGGGYLIGANWDKITGDEKDEAQAANRRAESDPVTAADARDAQTADINRDGFVTLDEVVAMEDAGLSDSQMIQRLRRTQQYFELTERQEQYLRDRGVSDRVIVAMRDMQPEEARRARAASERQDRISSDRQRE